MRQEGGGKVLILDGRGVFFEKSMDLAREGRTRQDPREGERINNIFVSDCMYPGDTCICFRDT